MACWLHTITSKRIERIKRMKMGRLTLYFLLATLYLLIGCERESQPKPEIKTLRLGSAGGQPRTLNPLMLDRTVAVALVPLIYNGLLRMNEQMMPVPDLAESWEISEDGLAYTFHLRSDVRFSDGQGLTSADAAFTYSAIRACRPQAPHLNWFDVVADWETPDKYTFRVILNKPFGLTVYPLTNSILPKHLLEHADMTTSEFNHKPIGTGPFVVKEWTPDNTIILERNTNYYEDGSASRPTTHDAQRPTLNSRLARIEARGYETSSELFTDLMKGETDLAFFLSQEQFAKVKDDPQFTAYQFPYIMTYAMEYNLEHPLFKDKDIRTALAYAVNIPSLIKQVDGGYGRQSTGSFTPGTWWYNPEVKPLEYDPALSLKLLNESGWSLNDSGILERAGQEFRFKMLVNRELRSPKQLGMLLYQDFFPLGIRIELADFNPSAYSEGKVTIPSDAAAYLTYYSTMSDPDALNIYWHSKSRDPLSKLWPYENPVIDGLFDLGRTLHDTAQRRPIYQQLHQTLYDDQPALFMYSHYNLSAVRKGFGNTDKLFTPAMPFWTIKDWKPQITQINTNK